MDKIKQSNWGKINIFALGMILFTNLFRNLL